jgi:hypothetical protein
MAWYRDSFTFYLSFQKETWRPSFPIRLVNATQIDVIHQIKHVLFPRCIRYSWQWCSSCVPVSYSTEKFNPPDVIFKCLLKVYYSQEFWNLLDKHPNRLVTQFLNNILLTENLLKWVTVQAEVKRFKTRGIFPCNFQIFRVADFISKI